MSCDIINIDNLTRIDTFNTWFLITNEIIDAINPIAVYDLAEGDGIELVMGTGDAGECNGVYTVNVDNGPGIQFDTTNRTIVGFSLYNSEDVTLGPTAATGTQAAVVQWYDQYIVNDQTSVGATDGTAKAILAGYMLPANIYVDPITFHGDVNIIGNFTVGGNDATIRANDLRIEDEQIELAYIESVSFQITGAGATAFAAGVTVGYADLAGFATGPSADAIGVVSAYEFGATGGTSVVTVRGPFTVGGVEAFEINGYLAATGLSDTEYQIYNNPSTTASYFTDDEYRKPPGIIVRGSSGDKEWLWDKDSDAWISDRGIGTTGGTVYAWRFDSIDSAFGASAGIFEFYTNNLSETVSVRLSTANGTEPSTWAIDKPATNYALRFRSNIYGSAPSSSYGFDVYPGFDVGNMGTTYSGVPVQNFADKLNADQLDGAHGLTTSTAYSIPVALSTGKIHPDWLDSVPYIAEEIYQANHGFGTGDCIRITATSHYVKALADTAEHAEMVGVVSYITDTDNFRVTFSGKITDLTGPFANYPLVTGSMYFLSPNTAGGLILNPDDVLQNGQVRKATLLASARDKGYILPYVGILESEVTDQVEIKDLVPIGTIVPFGGNSVPNRWILCDGTMYAQSDYPYLYNVITKTYYNIPKTFNKVSATNVILTFNNNIGIETGDYLKLAFADGSVIDEIEVVSVSYVNNTFYVGLSKTNAFNSGYYGSTGLQPKVYPSSASSRFFVPNLSGRFTVGTGKNEISSTSKTHSLAELGGKESVSLTTPEIPYHAHTQGDSVTVLSGSDITVVADSGTSNETGYSGGTADNTTNAHENRPPYLGVRYIIRAKPDTDAFILTGHNHDLRYIRYDGYHEEPNSNDLTEANRNVFRHNARVAGMPHGHTNSDGYGPTGGTHNHHNAYVRHDALYALTAQQRSNAQDNMYVWDRSRGIYRYGTYKFDASDPYQNGTVYGTMYFGADYAGLSGYNSDWALDLAGSKSIVGVTGIGYYPGSEYDNSLVHFRNGISFTFTDGKRANIENVNEIAFIDDGTITNLGSLNVDHLYTDQITSKTGAGITHNSISNFTGTINASTIDFLAGEAGVIRNFTTINGNQDGSGPGTIKNVIMGDNIQFIMTNTPNGAIVMDNNSSFAFSGETDNASLVLNLDTYFYDQNGSSAIWWDKSASNLYLLGSTDIVWQSSGGTIDNVDIISGFEDKIDLAGSEVVNATGGTADSSLASVNQTRRIAHVGAAMLYADGSGLINSPFTIADPWIGLIEDPPEWDDMSSVGSPTTRKNCWAMIRVDGVTGSDTDTGSYGSTFLHFQFPMDDKNLGTYGLQQEIPSDETAGTFELSSGGTALPYPSDNDAIHKTPVEGWAKYRIGTDTFLYVDLASAPNNQTYLKLAYATADGRTPISELSAIVVKWVVGTGSAYPGVL